MLSKITLALALIRLAAAHVLHAGVPHQRCGAPNPSKEQVQTAVLLAALEADQGLGLREETVTINTYFHVVATSDQEKDGYLSDETLEKQLRVMNEDYATSGFNFTLLNTTRTVNPTWAESSSMSTNEADMKSALRQGTYADLNVYFLTALDGVLGYCYFPVSSPSPEQLQTDGCSILASTTPNDGGGRFDLGKTVTHEVGHWMGLFHTFQGSCLDGDEVADTPAQMSPSSGCPVGRDSCPGGGPDPIHNYMDYSDDSCYEEFTTGQVARMHSSWEKYRV